MRKPGNYGLRYAIRHPVYSKLILLGLAGSVCMLTLLAAELTVRVLRPDVVLMGTDRALFGDDLSPEHRCLKPNSSGYCFGVWVTVDERGCRSSNTKPRSGAAETGAAATGTVSTGHVHPENGPEQPEIQLSAHAELNTESELGNASTNRLSGRSNLPSDRNSWLFLGDSVAFGPGVEFEEVFSSILQDHLPKTTVINTGVVGLDLRGYVPMLKKWLAHDPSIDRVTLVYCLNDVIDADPARVPGDGDLPMDMLRPGNRNFAVEAVTSFLRPRSKLFMLAKGTLSDPGYRYFAWDLWRYQQNAAQLDVAFKPLETIARITADAGLPLDIVVMPYEYQLRQRSPDNWLPQQQLATYLQSREIDFVDARDWFSDGDGKQFYLFGDPMHLSPRGHRRLAEKLLTLRNDNGSRNDNGNNGIEGLATPANGHMQFHRSVIVPGKLGTSSRELAPSAN